MPESELDLDFEELSSAEDFLQYFGVPFEPAVVQVNRLHIMQRFHDYIDGHTDWPEDDDGRSAVFRTLLVRAYEDFVTSDAQTEKVFKVFHMNEPQTTFVPVDLLGAPPKSGL